MMLVTNCWQSTTSASPPKSLLRVGRKHKVGAVKLSSDGTRDVETRGVQKTERHFNTFSYKAAVLALFKVSTSLHSAGPRVYTRDYRLLSWPAGQESCGIVPLHDLATCNAPSSAALRGHLLRCAATAAIQSTHTTEIAKTCIFDGAPCNQKQVVCDAYLTICSACSGLNFSPQVDRRLTRDVRDIFPWVCVTRHSRTSQLRRHGAHLSQLPKGMCKPLWKE